MIEWGEYKGVWIVSFMFSSPPHFKGQLYGTTAESVRQVVRSGRLCVLDCTLKAMECLYNAE